MSRARELIAGLFANFAWAWLYAYVYAVAAKRLIDYSRRLASRREKGFCCSRAGWQARSAKFYDFIRDSVLA